MSSEPTDSVDALLARASHRIGPFRLLQRLGEGGFAPVYLADEAYGDAVLRKVAVKVFVAPRATKTLGGGTDARVRAALVDEARALCRVEHPNVVRFHQIAEDPGGELLALAMELVRGTSVADMLDERRMLGVRGTLDVGVAVASALAAVHRAGLVHRDVKPQNVVEANGVYKLIDFGIAARGVQTAVVSDGAAPTSLPAALALSIAQGATVDVGSSDTTPSDSSGHSLAGTMGYIDPACLGRNAIATASSDLYALGCMLYECLSARLPASASAERPRDLVTLIVHGVEPAPPLRDVAPEVPKELAELVDALVLADRAARPKSAEWIVAELERIKRLELGKLADLPPESEGPFRGLACFEPRHRGVFLGRSAELASALEMLRTHGMLTVAGPSGSGKSSLARAAILPAIEDGALGGWPDAWDAIVATPGADAQVVILRALSPIASPEQRDDPDALVRALLAHAERTGRGVLLLVDQLEELVTQGSPAGRRYAVALLARLAARPLPGVRVVVAVRRDFLDPLFAEDELGPALGRSLLLVAPVSLPVWREILDEGLARYGYTLDHDARGEILDELRHVSDAMPIVQFALAKLWERRDPDRKTITRDALAAVGGVSGALDVHAEAVVAALVARHGPPAMDALFRVTLGLTTPQGTRSSVDQALLVAGARHPLAAEVIGALLEARLVTKERTTLAFAHDAVAVAWKRLARWIKEARADRELAAELEEQAARWHAGRERELLFAQRRLSAARALAARGSVTLSAVAEAFVRASRRAESRRVAGAAALACTMLVAAGLAFGLYRDSTQRAARTKAQVDKVERDVLNHRANAVEELQKRLEQMRAQREACERARNTEASVDAKAKTGR